MNSITNGKQPFFTFLRTQNQTNTWEASNSDFPVAVSLLAIVAVALLVVSYYIFVIRCCLNWQTLDPRHRAHREHVDPSIVSLSPMYNIHRGLDEWLINNIPAFQFKGEGSFKGCSVCLNDFQEEEMLRVVPRCNHVFHLDCIDVWLLNNASCPLCRSSISGRTKYPVHDNIIAPTSSPQELSSYSDHGGERSISLSTDLSGVFVQPQTACFHKKHRSFQHLPIMGGEYTNTRKNDDQFGIQKQTRRSFSMDSAADRGLYLQIQQIVRQNRNFNHGVEEGNSSSNNNERVRISSFFSFGHDRGSRSSSIIPFQGHT